MQRLFSLIFEEGENHDPSVCEDRQTRAIAEALAVRVCFVPSLPMCGCFFISNIVGHGDFEKRGVRLAELQAAGNLECVSGDTH